MAVLWSLVGKGCAIQNLAANKNPVVGCKSYDNNKNRQHEGKR